MDLWTAHGWSMVRRLVDSHRLMRPPSVRGAVVASFLERGGTGPVESEATESADPEAVSSKMAIEHQ